MSSLALNSSPPTLRSTCRPTKAKYDGPAHCETSCASTPCTNSASGHTSAKARIYLRLREVGRNLLDDVATPTIHRRIKLLGTTRELELQRQDHDRVAPRAPQRLRRRASAFNEHTRVAIRCCVSSVTQHRIALRKCDSRYASVLGSGAETSAPALLSLHRFDEQIRPVQSNRFLRRCRTVHASSSDFGAGIRNCFAWHISWSV